MYVCVEMILIFQKNDNKILLGLHVYLMVLSSVYHKLLYKEEERVFFSETGPTIYVTYKVSRTKQI